MAENPSQKTNSSTKKTGDNKKKRLNKYRRQKSKAPNIILQPRDVKILVAVNDHLGFLTREQIQVLFFGTSSPFESKSGKENSNGLKRACHRLKLLFHNGYLDRYAPRRDRQGIVDYRDINAKLYAPRPFIYHLTEEGAKFVAEAKGIPLKEVHYNRKFRERDESRLYHEMTINDFRITLTLAERAYKDQLQIVEWRSEKECVRPYNVKNKNTGKFQKKMFRPDAYFKIKIQDQAIASFLEVDTGTESHSRRIIDKIIKYKEYSKEGFYKKEYEESKFRVVFLTTRNEDRIINMKHEIEKYVRGVFWFTIIEHISYEPNFLFKPLWLKAGQKDHSPFYMARGEYFLLRKF